MPFIKYVISEVEVRGERMMAAVPLVDEYRVLNDNLAYISKSLDFPVESIHVRRIDVVYVIYRSSRSHSLIFHKRMPQRYHRLYQANLNSLHCIRQKQLNNTLQLHHDSTTINISTLI